jgi:zinc protease
MIGRNRNKLSLLLLVLLVLWPRLGEGNPVSMPPVHRITLPNQLVVLVFEDHSLPIVSMQLLVDAGSWRDPKGREGLANLTSKALLLGSATRSVNEINDELDFMGTSLESTCGRDYSTLSLQTLKKHMDRGFDLFLDILTKPSFPEEEIGMEAQRVLGSIQSEEDSPSKVAEIAFYEALFPNNPYGHPSEGTRESVAGITRESIVEFYGSYYHPNNSILAVGGDITLEEVKSKLIPMLTVWPLKAVPDVPFISPSVTGMHTIRINRKITQASILLGHVGMAREHKDYYAFVVMNYVLGYGNFSSRLVDEIRVRRGLAYSVASFMMPGKHSGAFQVIVQTQNASARDAVNIAVEQMKRIQEEPVSEHELEMAKKFLIGSFSRRFETKKMMADFLTQIEYFGLGLKYPEQYPSIINSITRDDILRVAREYLRPEEHTLVVVADLEEAGM